MKRAVLSVALMMGLAAVMPAQKPIPIIFDTDIGDDIDDALALALALQSPELDIRAVTTVIDDTSTRARLVWKELGLYGRQDIAVGIGASEPLMGSSRPTHAPQFSVLTSADTLPPNVHERAAQLIVETLMRSPEKLTLVPVGPLTNIALALKLEPRIKGKIERIVLMGGAFQMFYPEYNIVRDSTAAQIVFSSGVPVTAVGLDVTTKCKLQGSDLEKLRAARNPASQFLVELIELWQDHHPERYPVLHDPLAVAVALRPALVETQSGAVQVEVSNSGFDALTLFTPADRLGKERAPTTQVARQVDAVKFLELLVGRLAAAPRSK